MNNFDDFKLFIHDINPACVCLQETFFSSKEKEGEEPKINYCYYRKDKISESRAHGGVAVLVRSDIPSARIPLNTDLQVVAVKLQLHRSVTICSLYLPPNEQIEKRKLENLLNQLPGEVIIIIIVSSRRL